MALADYKDVVRRIFIPPDPQEDDNPATHVIAAPSKAAALSMADPVCETLTSVYAKYFSRNKAYEIVNQLTTLALEVVRQVMWSGIPREWVQLWADERGIQTPTTAMGPLMDSDNLSCRRKSKSPQV